MPTASATALACALLLAFPSVPGSPVPGPPQRPKPHRAAPAPKPAAPAPKHVPEPVRYGPHPLPEPAPAPRRTASRPAFRVFPPPPAKRPVAAAPAPAPAPSPAPLPVPAELGARLRLAEQHAAGPRAAGEAAMRLGAFHYARGEYGAAGEAFARAAARLEPARKPEALYWGGLSWLAAGSTNNARALLEEVADADVARRADARFAVAAAWEQDGRADRAYAVLQELLEQSPGECGPAALDRLAVLADRLHRPADAERARARLLATYPQSIEAAVATAALKAAPATASGGASLEAGRFASQARAKTLVSRAQRAGFAGAKVVARGAGTARTYDVVLGSYPDVAAARTAQARAAKQLGVAARVAGAR